MSRTGWVISGVAAVALALIVILIISETASEPPTAAPSAADKPVPTPQPASGPSNQPATPAQTAATATSGSPPGNAASPTVWNPADAAGDIVLANNNMSATKEGQKNSWASIRASNGKTTGKWFFRLTVDTTDSENGWIGGIAGAAAPLSDYIGDEAQGAGFQTAANFWQSGQNHANA